MKKLFFFLFIGVTGIGFGQSSQEIIDANTLIIIKETDSLSALKELANKKIDAETEKINRFEDSLLRVSNYTNLVNSIKINDSILEFLVKRKNISSRNIDRYTSKVLNDEYDSDNDSYKSRRYEKKENREKRLEGVIDFYNKSKSDILTWEKYLVDNRDSVQVMTLEQGNWSRSGGVHNSSAERNAFIVELLDKITTGPPWEEGKHVVIPSKIYSKWINELNITMINTFGYYSNSPSSSHRKLLEKINRKMDVDDYVIIRIYSITDKDGFGVPDIEAENYLNPWNYKVKGLLRTKKLKKVIEEYRANGAKRKIDDDTDDYIHHQNFWKNFFTHYRLVSTLEEQKEKLKKYTDSYDSLLTITTPMRSSRSQIENKLVLEKKSAERKISNLTNKINSCERIINRKDERILKVQSDEIMRIKLISEADSLLQIKNYELAISNYQQAQNLFNHADVIPKLENATELYAPILAKQQEEERVKQAEAQKRAALARKKLDEEMSQNAIKYLIDNAGIDISASEYAKKRYDYNGCFSTYFIAVNEPLNSGYVRRTNWDVHFSNGLPCYWVQLEGNTDQAAWGVKLMYDFITENYTENYKAANTYEEFIENGEKARKLYFTRAKGAGCRCVDY
mgnify:CR=1 FL=1